MKKLLVLSVCLLGLIACGPSKKLNNGDFIHSTKWNFVKITHKKTKKQERI